MKFGNIKIFGIIFFLLLISVVSANSVTLNNETEETESKQGTIEKLENSNLGAFIFIIGSITGILSGLMLWLLSFMGVRFSYNPSTNFLYNLVTWAILVLTSVGVSIYLLA